jgi:transcriptional regulator with XRE-family HTH domain
MSTRRWMGELEKWMGRSGQSKADVARRSKHSTAHVLGLFESPDPNPTLQLYLDVVGITGARFASVRNNTAAAVLERLKEIKDREKISTVALAKKTGMARPMLSTLLNHPDPNPSLATFDRIVAALNAEEEFQLVNILTRAVRLAIAAGATNADEVSQAVASAVEATSRPRHLHVVTDAPEVDEPSHWSERHRRAEQERRDAEERLQEANGRVAELCEKCSALQVANVALEKQLADNAAEIRRLRALEQRQRRGRLALYGAGVLSGLGLAAGIMRARR